MIQSNHNFTAPFHHNSGPETESIKPLIMGVLNITPDSFSDGGKYLDAGKAFDHACRMIDEGADILDLGAESSRPGAEPVDAQEEWKRLKPVLMRIRSTLNVRISIDSYKPEIIERCLDLGADIVNDIKATNRKESLAKLLIKYNAAVVVMHMKGDPQTMQKNCDYNDVVADVISELRHSSQQLVQSGVDSERIIVDPGIGFGKTVEANYQLLANTAKIRGELGFKLMVGISRKSFMTKTTGFSADSLTAPMAALHALIIDQGADVIRVHDIMEAKAVRSVARHFMENKIADRY